MPYPKTPCDDLNYFQDVEQETSIPKPYGYEEEEDRVFFILATRDTLELNTQSF